MIMFKLTTILAPAFTGNNEKPELLPIGHPLPHYLPKSESGWVVYVNKRELTTPIDTFTPMQGDEVVAALIPAGGDRATTRTVLQFALLATSFVPRWGLFLYMGGNLLLNAFLPAKTSKEQTLSDSYNWRHSANRTASDGTAMPVIYGKTRVKPVIKNRFIVTDGDKQYLHVLYSVAGHEIDTRSSIQAWVQGEVGAVGDERTHPDFPGATFIRNHTTLTQWVSTWNQPFIVQRAMGLWKYGHGLADITSIQINGNPIENYHDVEYDTRPGTADQCVMSGFSTTHSNEPQGTLLPDFSPDDPAGPLWTTVLLGSTDSQNLQIDLQFPGGLYYIGNRGEADTSHAYIYAQYKKAGDANWSNFHMEALPTTAFVYAGDYTAGDGNIYRYGRITRNNNKSFLVSIRAVDVDYNRRNTIAMGQYYVRVGVVRGTFAGGIAGDTVPVTFLNVSSIVYDNFSYPGEALLGIRALASGQLSNDFELTCVPERSTVEVYNPDTAVWDDMPANKHAWAIYDLLASGHADHPKPFTYGAGIAPSRINYAAFDTWATWLAAVPPNTLDYTLNITFDSFMTLWDAVLRICEEGRGMVTVAGAEISCVIDKAETPAQLFTVGNIVSGSFKEHWFDPNKKANVIEATFFDVTRDYARTIFSVYSSTYDTDASLRDAARMYLYGVTDWSQAYDLASYRLLCNTYQKRTISFEVAADALAAEPGDVVKVQHNVPLGGNGGRIVQYWATHPGTGTPAILLDREVTIGTGTYELEIRSASTGVIERNAITNAAGTASLLTFAAEWTITPVQYDLYAFGLQNLLYTLVRIIAITRTSDQIRLITAIDYSTSIYTSPAAPTGLFKAVANIFNPATSLTLTERMSRRVTGEYQSNIDVSWQPTNRGVYGEWGVYVRDVSEDDQNWIGEWNAITPYADGEKVIHNSKAYISLEDTNVNNEPITNE